MCSFLAAIVRHRNGRREALEFLDDRDDGVERATGGFWARRLGINAQHLFGAGGAHQDPAEVSDEDLDAVEVLAASDRPIENGFQVGVGEIAQRFFLLAVFGVEVDAAVMIFAEFLVQHGDELAETLAVPGHDFGEKQRIHGGVAFGQIQFGADAAAFFAAEEDIGFEHAVADVFETDLGLPDFAAKFGGDLVDHFGGGKSFGDVAGEFSGSGEMPEQDGKNLVRGDEGAVAIDGADAVGVAIEAETGVVFAIDHGAAQGGDVRFDGFGIHPAEEWVAGGANFFAGHVVAAEKFGEQAAAGAVHGIDDETKFGIANAGPVDEAGESFEIRSAHVERLDQFRLGRKRGKTVAFEAGEFLFDLGDDGGRGGTAVARFVFHAIPLKWIVAGGDLNSAGGFTQGDEEREGRSGSGGGRKCDGNSGAGEGFGGGAGETVGAESGVVADENFGAGFFGADNVAGDGVGDRTDIGEGEIFGDDRAPAVGAEYEFAHGRKV